MSRGYRVRWATEQRVVRSEDHLDLDLELLQILPGMEMQDILSEVLVTDGWAKVGDDKLKKQIEGVTAVIDLTERKVTLRVSEQSVVTAAARTATDAQANVAAAAQARQTTLDDKTARQLLKAEATVRGVIQASLQRVYERALEKKAASMGQVESITRSENEAGQLEMVIKVKV